MRAYLIADKYALRLAWLACALAAAVPGRTAAQSCDASPLLVRNANVWTSNGVLSRRDVLFRDGRVASIEPSAERAAQGVRTIDASGQTLLPGLVDTHLHFSIPGGLPAESPNRADAARLTGRQLIRSGLTSGRLHLASLEEASALKMRSADPCRALPRLQVGGPAISGAATRDASNFWAVTGVEDAVAKVERLRSAGVDWMAIHDADKFAPDVLQTLAAAARRAGIRLMAAGSTPAEIDAALTVDPDTLDYIDRSEAPTYTAALGDRIRARRDLTVAPTIGVFFRGDRYVKEPSELEDPANFEFLGQSERAHVLQAAKTGIAGADGERAQRYLATTSVKMRQLLALGVPLALASDSGSPFHFQAGAVWWELEAWRAMGATHRQALTAATIGAARVLHANDIGRLEVGSRADFVLYRGDVENGAFDARRVVAVGKGGVLFVADGRWIAN